jgi:isoleucyl-tRNA synthetase
VFHRDGSDAMRWFLMSSPVLRGGNLVVTERGIRDGVRQVLIPLWNAWYFFSLYANAFDDGKGYEARWSTSSSDVLDRYLLAKLRDLVTGVQAQLDVYDVSAACESLRSFVDVLTNWYIRRSRERFWGEDDTAAFDTLYTALEVLTRVAAPLLPLVSEEIWRGLMGGRSVHLTDWPDAEDLPADDDLVAAMDRAREVCSAALGLRKAGGLRVRLPLGSLTVVSADSASLEPFAELVADEVNVRELRLARPGDSDVDFGVSERLTVNARAAGPRLGKDVQKAIRASKSGDWSAQDGVVVAGGVELHEGEYAVDLVVDDAGEGAGTATTVLPKQGFVVLDTTVTPELEAVGLVRDVVRVVQQARRDAGLHVSDRIRLTVAGEGVAWQALVTHQDLLVRETLAVQAGLTGDLSHVPLADDVAEATVGDGVRVRVRVQRVTERAGR